MTTPNQTPIDPEPIDPVEKEICEHFRKAGKALYRADLRARLERMYKLREGK